MMFIFNFRKVEADKDPELLKDIFKLRYQVYCEEAGFLSPKKYTSGLETDEYDPYAIHFAATTKDNQLVGTVRLILINGLHRFPLEKFCTNLWIDRKQDMLPTPFQLAEISRLAVSKSFRRRADDGLFGVESYFSDDLRRKHPQIIMGLYREIYQESKRMGITHWYAAMEKKLHYALKRFSFFLEQIGPEVDYYGPVIPYLGEVQLLEEMYFRKHSASASKAMLSGLEKRFYPKALGEEYILTKKNTPVRRLKSQAQMSDAIVQSIATIEPLSDTTIRIIELSSNPDENFDEIIGMIERDPALTANFLKLCNSSYFGLPRKIATVRHALLMLGSKQIVKILWANLKSLSSTFVNPRLGYGLHYGELWRHSVSAAVVSQVLYKNVTGRENTLLFTAALLHDIGKTVLDQHIRDNIKSLKSIFRQSIFGYSQIEKAFFGIDHAELAGKIAKQWNFPNELVNAIQNHHKAIANPKLPELDRWTGLSDIVTHFAQLHGGFPRSCESISVTIKSSILEPFNLTKEDLVDVVNELPAALDDMLTDSC